MSVIRKVSSRDTKAKLLAAYNELAKAYRTLESQKSASAPAAAPAAAAPVSKVKSVAATSSTDLAGVVRTLQTVRGHIGGSFSGLQQSLTTEATSLESLRTSVGETLTQLKTLHGIEVGDDTLGELIGTYRKTNETAEEALSTKREAHEKDLEGKRSDWRKEQDEHARKVKEALVELKKSRARDLQEYKYELAQKHSVEEDQRAQAQKAFEAQIASIRETKETAWAEREKQVNTREEEYAELTDKAEAFDKEVASAKKKGESEGLSIARRETKAKAELLGKESEGKRRVFELRIASLQDTIDKQMEQISALSAKLDTALKQTQHLAVKAIDGAANTTSFEAIKEIAMEQAKNSGKGK